MEEVSPWQIVIASFELGQAYICTRVSSGEWWVVGGGRSGSCEKIQEKGDLILAGDDSDSVLWKCGSYV